MRKQMITKQHLVHEATNNHVLAPPSMAPSGSPHELLLLTTDPGFIVHGRIMTLVLVLLFALFLSSLIFLHLRRIRRRAKKGGFDLGSSFSGQSERESIGAAGESK
ncbi:hypothetical protein QJS04_geneDACA006043 [Acorus gramineus]|uniref:Uncharacterized protein n=1 Tax=Acorus gramineus TaxID=55184 RepID=A0AAV9B1F8_ACOGR|nr:hypothetical protein QJS04_geneDACA006043 [Acorus gramineus]